VGNFSDSWGRRTLRWCWLTVLTTSSASSWAQLAAPVVQTSAAVATLSLKDLLTQVLAANKDIRSKRAEIGIAATGIDRAAAAFQPGG
jgi:outer membrane protein TolC